MGVPFANSEEVCCLSSFFLCWVHPLLRAGWKGEMQAEVRARRSGPPPPPRFALVHCPLQGLRDHWTRLFCCPHYCID